MVSRSRETSVRIALSLCGLVSILFGRIYRGLTIFFPEDRYAWTVISWTLVIVGIINVFVAIAPQSWMRPLFGKTEQQWLKLPFKTLAGFSATSYAAVAVLSVLRPSMQVSPLTAYILCPSCVSTITVDPSLAAVFLFLAPTSAAAYGSIGAVIGLLVGALRRPDTISTTADL